MNTAVIRPTRYPELSYTQVDRSCWRFIDNSTGNPVGPQYRTMRELLTDLDRYAKFFGCR